jgi:hypothetical protein
MAEGLSKIKYPIELEKDGTKHNDFCCVFIGNSNTNVNVFKHKNVYLFVIDESLYGSYTYEQIKGFSQSPSIKFFYSDILKMIDDYGPPISSNLDAANYSFPINSKPCTMLDANIHTSKCCNFLGFAHYDKNTNAAIYRCSFSKKNVFYVIDNIVRKRPISWVNAQTKKNDKWAPFWHEVASLCEIHLKEHAYEVDKIVPKNKKGFEIKEKICDRCSKGKTLHYQEHENDLLRCPGGGLGNHWVYVNEDKYGYGEDTESNKKSKAIYKEINKPLIFMSNDEEKDFAEKVSKEYKKAVKMSHKPINVKEYIKEQTRRIIKIPK